jgi:hypothetical protein
MGEEGNTCCVPFEVGDQPILRVVYPLDVETWRYWYRLLYRRQFEWFRSVSVD